MSEKTRAEELHDEYRRKVWEDSKSGSENFDKYLLTFSSGALGLSLTFIKDVVPLKEAIWIPSLIGSWIAFVLCILVTLVSFRISIRALEKMVPHLNEFYLENKVDAFNKHLEDLWTKAVDWCAYAGIFLFVLGLIFTMIFVGANIREAKLMSEKENPTKASIKIENLNFGCKPVAMTPTEDGAKQTARPTGRDRFDEGAKPPMMTPARPPVSPPQPSQPQTPKK